MAAQCQSRQQVDSGCQTTPVRALCTHSAPGRLQPVAKLLGGSFGAHTPASRQARQRAGEKETSLNSLHQQLKPCRGLPQATNLRPRKGDPTRPRLRGGLGAREVPVRSDSEEAGAQGREPRPGKGSDSPMIHFLHIYLFQ